MNIGVVIHTAEVRALDQPGQVHFGFGLEPHVESQLQAAAANVGNTRASLQALTEAQRRAPDQLEVLQALYKFHCYRGNLQLALDLVFQVLIKASLQGGFSRDWAALDARSTDWSAVRGPARSFLYALKALAFIRLRQNDCREAANILLVLRRLDPQDQVGAEVVRELLASVADDCTDE